MMPPAEEPWNIELSERVASHTQIRFVTIMLTACDTCSAAVRSGMDRDDVLDFLRRHRLCVQASVTEVGAPQAAVVGYAVTDELEIVFDTLASTRKLQNLRQDPRIALVVGWDEEQTLQIEGLADEPSGEALARLKRCYLEAFPGGAPREHWPGICYVRVRAHWARFSDFRDGSVFELDKEALSASRAPQL
jgi:general stress protein 26